MATFDEREQKIVVRVVYDGPALAGKTTNLEQICNFFTPLRRSDLYSPKALAGRTLFFDWMQLEGGVVAGYGLRCHLLTVPGQAVLSRRRWHLLDTADVVVFVTSSSEEGLADSLPMYNLLRGYLERTGRGETPLLIQANKQDLPGAASPHAVAEALGTPSTLAIPANAATGAGVRETVVLAIRAAAQRVQRQVLAEGLDSLRGEVVGGEALMREMTDREAAEPQSPLDVVISHNNRLAAEEPKAGSARIRDPEAAPGGDPTSSRVLDPLPPLPRADVPSGLVWPSANGREILQRIPFDHAVLHSELSGRSGTADGSGRSDAYIYEAGIWCLKTAQRRRFLDVDEARDALLQLVRHKLLLGDLLVQNTVLTVQQGPTGDFWLWTVTPWLTTLRGAMTHAVHRKDGAELERCLVLFGQLAVRALILAAKSEVLLDVHPSNFASLRDRCYYLDDDIARGARLPAVGFALLRRVDEYADWPAATEAYIGTVSAALARHLTELDVRRLDLRRGLQDVVVRSPVALSARDRFLAALKACPAADS